MYGLAITTEPTTEPITAAEAKLHCGIAAAVTAWDTYIGSLITAARKYAEDYTGRSFITTVWAMKLDCFPYCERSLRLPRSPLANVGSITYIDTDGNPQTWGSGNYVVSASREPGRVSLTYSSVWPTIRYQADAVTITFTAGYGNAAAVPQAIKQAIYLTIGHWFEHRSEVEGGGLREIPMGAKALLEMYRVGDEFTEYAA